MLLTSWIRTLRKKFFGRRYISRGRRKVGSSSQVASRQLHLAETLEERSLLTALVIDSQTFLSTAATPGINVINSTLDANNDGISDYDNLVIASSDLPIIVSGGGTGIRINLSNLTGLNHITVENVNITGGAGFQGVSITLNNVPIQSLTVDQATVTTTNANGVDINLQNIGTVGGADVTVKDSSIRSTNATGVQVSLGSTTVATHLGALTFADSTLEGIGVTSTAGSGFQTSIDQTAVNRVRVQDAATVARGITYNLNRTTVGDFRVEDNVQFRGLSVTATDSPLQAVTIADNTNINVGAAGATDGIRINATSTNVAGTVRSDVTNLIIEGNTISGNVANANTVNGIVLNMVDSNLGSYDDHQAGGTITGNTIRNLSSATSTAIGLQITATASRTFVNGNSGRPLLLDFDGDTARDDLNGITNNLLTPAAGVAGRHILGQGFVVTTSADTSYRADVTGNTIRNINREGMSLSFRDKPTTDLADLVTNVSAATTTIPFINASVLPTTPFLIQIELEQMLVTSVVGSNLTVTRGVNGTAATVHAGTANSPLDIDRVIAAGQLTSTVTSAATLLPLANTIALPATPFVIQVEQEQMRVTAVSGNTLTVTRGINGTTAVGHPGSVGSPVQVSLAPDAFDSLTLNLANNIVDQTRRAGVDLTMTNTAIGSFSITNNDITGVEDILANTPDGLSISLLGTNVTQEATATLKKSFIENNHIGVTTAGVAGQISGNGLFITAQEATQIQDLQIRGNTILNSLQNGISMIREDRATMRTVDPEVGQNRAITISGNTIGLNTIDGISLDMRNGSLDLLDFDVRSNSIGVSVDAQGTVTDIGNGGDGIDMLTQADARLLVDMDRNTIRFNNGSGVHARDVFGDYSTDKRQVGGTWTSNIFSDNSQSGITIRGRHGLFDEVTGIATPLVIGLEGQGNDIENNGGNGIRIHEPQRNGAGNPTPLLDGRDFRSVATGEVSITNNLIRNNSITDLVAFGEIANSRGGIYIHSAKEKVDIRLNQIEANFGKGIDIQVVHDLPTLPTNVGLPGNIQATIRDNVITAQVQIGNEQGDGIELSSYELVFAGINGRSNNALLNRMDVLGLNNFIDSNAGRGVDLLNIGNGTMQVRFGDNTEPGRNTIVGNGLDGFRVINTNDRFQTQDGLPTAANPIGTPNPIQSGDILFSPDIMLDVSQNTIRDNGIDLPASVQQGGVSEVNGSGLVVLAAGVGYGNINPVAGGEDSFAATFPNEVGVSSGDPLDGNGRVNLRVDSNTFEGNFGNDIAIIPYVAVIPPQTTVSQTDRTWPDPPTSFFIQSMWHDGLARVNAVVTGNTGNGLDVIRVAPDYTNNEDFFKSRTPGTGGRGGPFASGTRPRNATRLATDDIPISNVPGYSFVYPGYDERDLGVLGTPQPTTLRVETGFDRSGTTQGFAFFDPAAPGPGSDDNFDDHVVGTQQIVNGRVDTVWDSVLLGTFTYPNVDSPSSLRASVSPFVTPRSTTPGVVTINFSEFVRFVDITDLRLLRDGLPISLVGLAVSPVNNTQDPNNPGAFSSFTVDLSSVTAASGNYQLQVLAVDSSNPTFTPVRDIHLQLNGQGNTLVRVIDGDGVLQDYALNHQFVVDNGLPVGTIVAVTPDPRNAAAGIITVNFSESVTGVDINDFELYRNGTLPINRVNLGSVTVVQVSSTEYQLNLNQLTGAAGDYELRLVSTDLVTPILDSANNLVSDVVAVGVAASDAWTVDTTLPFVTSIVTTPASSPSNTPVSTVLLNFSEGVTGVTIDDLTLTYTNSAGTVSNIVLSGITLFQNTASQYELDLSTVSNLEGSYQLTVNAVNAGIFDLAQNAFESDFSTSWVLDITAPQNAAIDIVDVAPDPRTAPVDSLTTIFNEPVSGLTIGQYVLAYDDGSSATGGAISNTTNAGPIVVTSTAHGLTTGNEITIYGVQGNTNANGVFTVTVLTANSFSLNGSVGNGLYTGGGRWARTIGLGASTLAQANVTGTRWLANLATVTNNPGVYIVSLLSNAGATDAGGNLLATATGQANVAAQDIWTYGPDVAPVGVITALPASIGTNAGIITINFSEPLQQVAGATPVDLTDFRLRRGGVVVPLTGATINQTSATSFDLDLTGTGLTDINGNYELSLLTTDAATPIRDATGNLLQASFAAGIASQITWTKIAADPSVTSILGVFTDPGFNTDPVTATKLRAVQTLTINFSVPVTFTQGLSDASQYFTLTRQALSGTGPVLPVSLDGVAITQVTTQQFRVSVSTLTGADGKYFFTVLKNDAIRSIGPNSPLLNSRTLQWSKDGTIRPNEFTDAPDAVGNPVLGNEIIRTAGGKVTLRAAVQEANALAGDDVIELDIGTYVLTIGGVQEDFGVSGDLDIRDNLTIRGKGVGQTIIDASGLPATQRDRIFQIFAGSSLTLQGITLQGGNVLGSEDGGAIRNSGTLVILDSEIKNNTSQDDGGAIINAGVATITRTTIANNTAVATGGAIRNQGTLTITSSTLSGNRSTSHGGAVMNVTGGAATLEGVTISGNQATSGAGGGIRNDGTLRLINDTIAFNRSIATQGGAGISRNLGTVTIGNTIVSNNQFTNNVVNDLAGTFVSIGGNIIQTPGAAVGFGVQDQLNANPNLQALSPNGGPTQTHAIQFNSIAVDTGLNANVTAGITTDQRGAPRFLDGPTAVLNAVDVGAFEFGTFFVNTSADTPDVILNNGLAQDGLGRTSLRAAIMESNALAGENAIILNGQTYMLSRTTPDVSAPTLTSITGVPTTPYTTGSAGSNVIFTFSEAVGALDPTTGLLGALTINDFQLTRTGTAAPLPLTAAMLTKLSDTQYQLNLSTLTGITNGQYTIGISPTQTIRDAEGNLFALTAKDSAIFVRGTDTFAPTVTLDPVTSPRLTNAGLVRITFNERVNNVSLANFVLTRDVGAGPVAVPLTGVPITIIQDTTNFQGRTVVTLNLATVTALDGIYQLTLNPTVGTTTIRDAATIPNNLAAGGSINWTKTAGVQFNPVTPDPRIGSVSSVTLQFSENVAGVAVTDFALTYDDGSGIGPQPVDLTTVLPTLTPTAPVATPNGQAASLWTLTFPTNASARDGVYALDFVGANLLTVTGTTFVPNVANEAWTIGEDAATIGDLDLDTTTGSLQIIGAGANATTNALGLTVNPTVIDGLTHDRVFDVLTNSVITVSGIEMKNGRVVLERNGGAIRNLGNLTINDSEILSSFADGNGGGISNGNSLVAGTLTLNRSSMQSNSAGSAASGSLFGKGGAIFNDSGSVTISDGTYSSNTAFTDGGVIYNDNNTTVLITSANLASNRANRDGGALYNGDTSTLTILSTTLSGNRADNDNDGDGEGGAIYTESLASLQLDDSILRSNTARVGGALYNDDAVLTLNDNFFELNTSLNDAGAIYNSVGGTLTLNNGLMTTNSAVNDGGAIQNYGVLTITGTEFLNNSVTSSSGRGGAIYNEDGTVSISNVEFNQNLSSGDAGAIYNEGDANLTLSRIVFNSNEATNNGGAIYNNDFARISIDQTTFAANVAQQDGGALYNNSEFLSGTTRSATITASTFNGNQADHGGAIFNTTFGGVTLENSTLSANKASIDGGALTNYGTASMLNSTVYLNTAPAGSAISSNLDGVTNPLATVTLMNTIVAGGGAPADIEGPDANFVDGGNNLIEDAGTVTTFTALNGNLLGVNPQLDELKDNGGATQTHALLFGSPARDAGNNIGTTTGDQRGFTRIFDGDGNGIATVDIGAFESGFIINSFDDTVDENILDGINADRFGVSTLRATIMQANARVGEDTIILSPGTYTLDLGGRDEDGGATGDLDVLDSLNIIGSGTDQTFIDATEIDRIFHVLPGISLNLSNLTLLNGNASSTDNGGAILNQGTVSLRNVHILSGTAGRGGGIFNSSTGTLTVDQTLLRGNEAILQGGAIYNDGTLTLTRSELGVATMLAANLAKDVAVTTVTVADVTPFSSDVPFLIQIDGEQMRVTSISGNNLTVVRAINGVLESHTTNTLVTQGNFANAHGGGLYNLGSAVVREVFFVGNVSNSRGGGIFNAASSSTLSVAVAAGVNANTITLLDASQFPTSGLFIIQIESEQMLVTGVAGNVFTVTRNINGTGAVAHAVGTRITSINLNTMDLRQTTFADNFASSRGAAIYNEDVLNMTNSTLSSNASGSNAGIGNTLTGQVTITNSTIVDNVAYRGGGVANTTQGQVTVRNTILANNVSTTLAGVKAQNARGTITSGGNNFVGNNADSVGFVNNVNSDQVGSSTSPFDPVIEGLSNNGGSTLTQSPRGGSPAIDAGNNVGGDTIDQRGATRPTNGDSDIGAVEVQDIHLVGFTDVSMFEGNSGSTLFRFTLTLGQASVEEVRIGYATQGDTAFAGEDFIAQSGTVVFTPGTLIQTITIEVNGDMSIETDEQFFVNLFNAENVTLDAGNTRAVGTIRTEDTGFRVTDVNKVEKETGSAPQEYKFSISIIGAPLAANQVVNVTYTINNGTATLGSDYALGVGTLNTEVLTFTAGPNGELPAAQTRSILVSGDDDVEGNEFFDVQLSAAGLPFEFGKDKGVGTIFNDDLGFRITGTSANEADPPTTTPLTYTVTLREKVYSDAGGSPVQVPVTATVSTVSGTATSGQDFNAINSTVLPFTGNTLSQTVTATVLGDLRYEVSTAGALAAATTAALNDTTLTLNSVAALPTIAAGEQFVILIDGEQMLVTNVNSGTNQVTVTRAFNGTLAAPHGMNAVVNLNGEIFSLATVGGTVNGLVDANTASQSFSGLGFINDNDPPPDVWHIYRNGLNIVVDLIETVGLVVTTTNILTTNDLATAIAISGDQVGDNNPVVVPVTQDDLFVVDFGFGNPIPTGGLTVNGGNQVGADTLQLIDPTNFFTFNNVVYNSLNANSGSVVFNGTSTVNYTGLEPVLDLTNADNRTFNTTTTNGVADNIVVTSGGGLTSISSVIGGSAATFESVTFKNPTTSVTVNGNDDVNNIQVSGGDGTFASSLTINALGGADPLNASGWTLVSTLNGGDGNDTITGGTAGDSINGGNNSDSIIGNFGNDTILGGAGNDIITGGDGRDFINGEAGDDNIQGNNDVDTLTGGDDNDVVDGGAGDESVDGGSGNDTVIGGTGMDTLSGGDGNDSLSGGDGNDALDGGFGMDTLSGDAGVDSIDGGPDFDIVATNMNVNQTLNNAQVILVGVETDILVNLSVEGARLLGGASNNVINASGFTLGPVTLMGGLGDDTLTGTTFNDVLDAGITNDFTGLDLMIDPMNINDGNDTLNGGLGNDTINGRGGNDTLTGGDGDDLMIGGAGNDTVNGGIGNDSMQGNGGVDSLLGDAGIDTLDGGESLDTLRGGNDGDSLLGGEGNDSLFGDAGEDTLEGGGGADTGDGGTGNDSVGGGLDNDFLIGGDGDDSVNGNEGNDTLNGNIGADTLFGGSGDDSMIATDGNDYLLGQGGLNDRFTYEGDATLADTFTITAAGNGVGGPLSGVGLARLNLTPFQIVILETELFTLNLNGGNDLVTVGDLSTVVDLNRISINGGTGNDTIDGTLSPNVIVGLNVSLGDGNDSFLGTAANDTVNGDLGLDTIVGNDGADSILGGDGNDNLNGNARNDTILGGAGDDSIQGGSDEDSIDGGDGKDSVYGQGGSDSIVGGNHDDLLDGGTGLDTIRGGAGNDKIAGREEADSIFGEDGNDTIKGGTGNDTISGGNGLDIVNGDEDNDYIQGDADNDYLLGGSGNDRIYGGAGNDVCMGMDGNDTVDGQGGSRDTVLGGSGTGINTKTAADLRVGATAEINELFRILVSRPNIFSELNF